MSPPSLKNVAFWDYWDNTQWAEEIGVGGTRVQVMSLSHGWIWFIPISPTRSSVGLVTAADYFKQCNMSKEELYMKSLQEVPRIAELLKEGKREGTVRATKDWSFYSNKAYGTNWFLVGESLGFADPILSAGLTLTHRGAQELAYTIIALDEQAYEAEWLKVQYQYFQIKRVQQHIQFANFWYASNGQLSDLRAYTAKIAEESGLNLTTKDAFRWLGTGGFIEEYIFSVGFGGVGLTVVSDLLEIIMKGDIQAKYAFNWSLNKYNMFEANLEGAKEAHIAYYKAGKVNQCRCFVRGNKKLPILEVFSAILKALGYQQWGTTALLDRIIEIVQGVEGNANRPPEVIITACAPVLEFMLTEGWIRGWFDPAMPKRTFSSLGAAGAGLAA